MSGDDDSSDFTRIEDLSEFLHEDDPELDKEFEDKESEKEETPPSVSSEDSFLDDEDTSDDFSADTPTDPDIKVDAFQEEEEEESLFSGSDEEESDNDPFGESTTDFQTEDSFSEEASSEEDGTLEFNSPSEELISETPSDDFETQTSELVSEDPSDEFDTQDEDLPLEEENLKEREQEEVSESMAAPAPPETFKDVKEFATNISYGAVTSGGNPPFSIILRGLRYEEDADDIITLLREHALADDKSEPMYRKALENGNLLISQISEYSAIYLAHRLRRFDIDLQVGLSDELHPSKNYDTQDRGLVSKRAIHQNISEDHVLKKHTVELEDIQLATTPQLENYTIYQYIGVVSSHTIVKEEELHFFNDLASHKGTLNRDDQDGLKSVEQGLNQVYQRLAMDLRNQGHKLECNAIVGLNYQLTPLLGEEKSESLYQITCTGNAVWVHGHD